MIDGTRQFPLLTSGNVHTVLSTAWLCQMAKSNQFDCSLYSQVSCSVGDILVLLVTPDKTEFQAMN
jgi:hypothetical protein